MATDHPLMATDYPLMATDYPPDAPPSQVYCASEKCEVVSILSRDFLQLVNKSEVVRRSFKELQKGAGGSRPSLFVANRPMPEKPPPPKKLPIHAYK